MKSAHDTGTFGVEQKVSRILPVRDRVIDRNALLQCRLRIGEPAKEDQGCASSAQGQGMADWYPLLLCERDQASAEIMGPPELAPHHMVVPQSAQHRKQLGGSAQLIAQCPRPA